MIRKAAENRGVIIFTDPDSPGNRIRSALNQAVPGCKNAFVQKTDARTEKKVGIEHAPFEVLDEALRHLVTYEDSAPETISVQDMYDLGLAGSENSAAKLHIGFGNARAMRQRLNRLGLDKEEVRKELEG